MVVVGDELFELGRRDLAEAFEARHFVIAEAFGSLVAFSLRVAVSGLFLVADPKDRRFEDEHMAGKDQFFEKAQEVSQQQIADVHAVDIGVGSDHDPVVTQPLEIIFDAECAHDVVELLVLVDRLSAETVGVEGFSLERINSLGLDIAGLDHGAAGRVALGEEDCRFLASFALCVRQVDLAVDQLGDADRHLFGPFLCLLLDCRQLFADPLVVLDLFEQLLRFFGLLVEP